MERVCLVVVRAACGLVLWQFWVGVLCADRRPFSPDDLARLGRIHDVILAPTDDMVAVVRQRPPIADSGPVLTGSSGSEVWLAPLSGGPAVKVANNDPEFGGYVAPAWSPDGARLGILVKRSWDSAAEICVWEKSTGKATRPTTRRIAPESSFVWVDGAHLVAAMVPEGVVESDTVWGTHAAMREWRRQEEGRTASTSVIDIGASGEVDRRPQVELVVLDVTTGSVRIVDRAPSFEDMRVSPDGRHVAVLKDTGLHRPDWSLPVPGAAQYINYRLILVDASGRIESSAKTEAATVVLDSFRWAPDGRNFAFLGKVARDVREPYRVFRGTVAGDIAEVPLKANLSAHTLVWADSNRLLVFAEPVNDSETPTTRGDWWVIAGASGPRNVTQALASVPDDLRAFNDGKAMLGVAAGDLWRFDIDSTVWVNLTSAFGPAVSDINAPAVGAVHGRSSGVVVVSVPQGNETDFYRVDIQSGSLTRLTKPSKAANLIAYSVENDDAVFLADESTGTFLTVVKRGSPHTIMEINQLLRDIVPGECTPITYRSLDGQDLKGWIILPPGYKAGERYPLVTWVYAGAMAPARAPSDCRIDDDEYNLQLFAAHGYAVLLPSMPLPPEPDKANGTPSDPYLDLGKGVLPAVDRAIELGIADPKRLAVAGHSFGGYSTYGLVTLTNRFCAAIALAAPSDLISGYGTFRALTRYYSYADMDQRLLFRYWAESGQGRMGSPPWKDVGRYIRNSPIFYVDRVQTPVLILQGDMDMVPLSQGEEFFAALYRQGKRARFVRYWGEGHFLFSPANIRDMWAQIYAWLDEFFGSSIPAERTGPQ